MTTTTPVSAQESPACPLESQSGRTLVNFPSATRLVAHLEEQSLAGPFPTEITAGNYKVTFVSYDNHSERPPQYQPNEQWLLSLYNGDGATVALTGAISDLPNDSDLLTEVIDNNFNVSQNVFWVITHHAAFPNPNPNSINPVCAAFDAIISPTPIATASPLPSPIITPLPTPSSLPTPSPTPSPTPTSSPSSDSTSSSAKSVGIAVDKNDHKDTVRPGGKLTYTIEVRNTGEDDFTQVTVKDTLPSAFTATAISGSGALEGAIITWKDHGLSSGEKITFTVTGTVKSDTDAGHTLVNTVTAKSEDKGPSATDTDTTVVEREPRIAAENSETTGKAVSVPITAATGTDAATALAALTSASSMVTLSLRRWWI